MKETISFSFLGVLMLWVWIGCCGFQVADQTYQEIAPKLDLKADTIQARKWVDRAEEFENTAHYDSSLIYYQLAKDIYELCLKKQRDTTLAKLYIKCEVNSGIALFQIHQYKKALNLLDQAEAKIPLYLNESHHFLINIHNYQGSSYMYLGDYEKALTYFNKALSIPYKSKLFIVYRSLGIYYRRIGKLQKALENYSKSKTLMVELEGKEHAFLGSIYINMGNIYMDQNANTKALECFHKAKDIFSKTLGEKHPVLAQCHNGIGTGYRKQEQYSASIEHYQKAIYIYQSHYGNFTPRLANPFLNLGNIYRIQGHYSQAIQEYNKGLQMALLNSGKRYLNTISHIYVGLGNTYFDQDDLDQGLHYYHKALNVRISNLGPSHPLIADLYSNLGIIYRDVGQFEMALEQIQKAISINVNQIDDRSIIENPSPEDNVLDAVVLTESLSVKSDILYQYYNHTKELEHLKQAYSAHLKLMQWVEYLFRSYYRKGDKLALSKNSLFYFERGIEVCMELFQQTQKDHFLEQVFTLMEKSRSLVLLETLQSKDASAFGEIPDTLLEKEQTIAIDLTFYEKSLFEERLKNENADSSKMNNWEEKVFSLKSAEEVLTKQLETEYPHYYNLKYGTNELTIAEVQNQLLQADQAFIEYLTTDSLIYVALITKNESKFIKIQKDFPLTEWVGQLRRSLYNYQLSGASSDVLLKRYTDTLVEKSHLLYQKLIQPLEEAITLPHRLIISTDDVLGYIPFDVLLYQRPEQQLQYRDYPYLLHKYQISYAYSAALSKQMKDNQRPRSKNGLLALAANFQYQDESKPTSRTRADIYPLENTISEAKAIQAIIGGKTLLGSGAQKVNFINQAPKYQLLHLATHGKANDQLGDYSFLAFPSDNDTSNAEFLYVREIYNLELNADMVVLSACETGIGQLQKGEGMVSLARGFASAGAKSLISSLWSVDDAKTTQLMTNFYDNLNKRMNKDMALQQAKLDYLSSNPQIYAHPFYWSGFIGIGDMEPVVIDSSISWWFWFVVFTITLSIGVLFKTLKSNYL